ncbi:MAG: DUF4105 domain-containing protein [Treponema sp.]|jgi:hypothetical protein|nr:DUF4105 domain-containing protein [Treponema sp.]
MPIRFSIFILILTFAFSPVYAQDNTVSHPADNLLFKIAIYGPSDEIFIWWGHAALIVENTRWNFSRVFDWGVFSYPGDSFLKDFISERVRYKVTEGRLDLDIYIEEDRDITIYTLDLDRQVKETILSYAENKVLPDNCYYDYHEFRDNCSTGVRDILNLGLGGQLKTATGNITGRFGIRQHVRRFTWFRPFSDWFLGILMGRNLDEKITVWDEMFLPVEIARNITDFTYIDDSGRERKLVSSARIFNASKNRPPVLNEPIPTWPFALMAGIIAAVLLLLLHAMRKKYPRPGRILWGLSQSLFGLFLGGAGCVLVFGLYFMNNDYIQRNINILFVNPLLLAAAPLGILSALNKPFSSINPEKCLRVIWTYVFIMCGITALFRFLPLFSQLNQSVQGIVLPVAFAFSRIHEKTRGFNVIIRNLKESRYGKNTDIKSGI